MNYEQKLLVLNIAEIKTISLHQYYAACGDISKQRRGNLKFSPESCCWNLFVIRSSVQFDKVLSEKAARDALGTSTPPQ